MDGPAGVKLVAGTGTEQTRYRSGKHGVESICDADCDAIVADRIELLTRAVILVAGMNLAEAEPAAVLARVVAELTSQTSRILDNLAGEGRSYAASRPQPEIRPPRPQQP